MQPDLLRECMVQRQLEEFFASAWASFAHRADKEPSPVDLEDKHSFFRGTSKFASTQFMLEKLHKAVDPEGTLSASAIAYALGAGLVNPSIVDFIATQPRPPATHEAAPGGTGPLPLGCHVP